MKKTSVGTASIVRVYVASAIFAPVVVMGIIFLTNLKGLVRLHIKPDQIQIDIDTRG